MLLFEIKHGTLDQKVLFIVCTLNHLSNDWGFPEVLDFQLIVHADFYIRVIGRTVHIEYVIEEQVA